MLKSKLSFHETDYTEYYAYVSEIRISIRDPFFSVKNLFFFFLKKKKKKNKEIFSIPFSDIFSKRFT